MRKVYLTEGQLRSIIESTIKEESFFKDGRNPLSRLGDFIGGIKGIYRGEGYEYGASLTSLGRFLQRLKKLDKPNAEVIKHLDMLSQRIDKSSMNINKKDMLKGLIDGVKKEFNDYQAELDNVINTIKTGNLSPTSQPSPQPSPQPPTP